ncbi:hypothetical protein [Acidomonas methanolica]|uniref:Uncharacterized protein n=1 Tax=Acidomonas methanolica NBRC 104435 TaxID=1231351 RepID=A0A023D2V9_ACIMT|nr:hypothetical protein [Acidomonas methanolica]MBU2654720.1 hypothetical protein [Acidomonas methanolica]TCS26424.1 hypothetical protein EDC31_11466 [Acidomonas methanolica]GAJ28503.1 hypothetical protein Amme_030_003 [Acidomonas methanolica NBRC 104435]GBQ46790.1 hypothetical protein AA0498_0372 [Acidomonas methanolica]GEK99781.1 hypothetical protein AME01nite_22800 [Acidomonas methanolica NBRC 104435]
MNEHPEGSGVTGAFLARPIRQGDNPEDALRRVLAKPPDVAGRYAEAFNSCQRALETIRMELRITPPGCR